MIAQLCKTLSNTPFVKNSEISYNLKINLRLIIIRQAYETCKKWSTKSPDDPILLRGFWLFMGRNNSDHFRIIKYFTEKNVFEGLDYNHFRTLFKKICIERDVDVKVWAVSRIDKATKRTILETERLKPEQTDDGASSCNDESDEEEKERIRSILKDSFDDCRRWLHGDSKEPLADNIGLSGFCCYMDLSRNDTILNDFFENNLDACERMADNYSKDQGHQR
ncbi:uncharacterized protein LOC126841277 [Adelges cooleyi]|uniref:uncharacterized protein LOC126841277 n=1 Tax=Adelges cooleyi TaxID=133065 RepID=UPI0021807323|nr:uncharacterized protein LOC126841277 [Adelges cooleyi]